MNCQLSVHTDEFSHTLRPHTKFKGKGADKQIDDTHVHRATRLRTQAV